MEPQIDRRHFVKTSGLLLAGAALPSLLGAQSAARERASSKRFKKALGFTMIQGDLSVEDKLKLV